eukprot:scaffold421_cov382-Prasinococcus_capsulatus_cf.AAC.12
MPYVRQTCRGKAGTGDQEEQARQDKEQGVHPDKPRIVTDLNATAILHVRRYAKKAPAMTPIATDASMWNRAWRTLNISNASPPKIACSGKSARLLSPLLNARGISLRRS